MKAILVTFGSRGDVHPMLALGQALQARGHRAMVLTNPAFGDEVAQAGLEFVPVGTEDDYRHTVEHPKLWHPVDGLGVMWRYLLRPALRPTFEALQLLCRPAAGSGPGMAPLVLASPLAMGARVAQEALGIRLVSTYTSAMMLRSVQDPLTIAQWQVPRYLPNWARHGIWKLLDRVKLDPLVKPALEALRQSQGLPPLAGAHSAVFGPWIHSPLGGLTLFPPWFAAARPDWPAQVHAGAFPLYDDPLHVSPEGHAPLDSELQAFMDAGPAPVVFMPGSAQQGTESFFRSAVAACAQLGVRAVLLGHSHAVDKGKLPPSIWSAAYFPFARLLPRARAIVHHGGIGTSAQALRAGIPQLVWPQAYDQFDNAMHLERLGVGRRLRSHPLETAELATRLQELENGPSVRVACQRWARELAGSSLAPACAWLEALA